ncbi:hypothetical protein A3A39_02385 [Candidatus Kaiserbacteria bacterium RIFCSPLOWO2_01_FULL_54_13]|uniref:Holo-[acyl-carrier-protein] synthase n=1 Tax=Candidatus Kaiserbacteria bacterium RIFCSPLOWO2_01_FULL_54_13 TaxID=1798512 RepID=A0A1F6F131_9BACT|nr:MAG: hypothetical protein A3A39_02385 [Candidatus Kaiserbacteria bacterium RIFCSPLOWO2_01_FULL_54_13]
MKSAREFGIGADIEEIGRFEKLDRTRHRIFLNRVYTDDELSYCFSMRRPAQHLAARFCAKESVIKALSGMGMRGIAYRDIRIRARGDAPTVSLNQISPKIDISLTMAHAGRYALAAAFAKKL